MRLPSSVRCDSARSRRSNSPPSSASSALIARVREGCATWHRSAALVKFSVSLTARKYRIWCISNVRPPLRTHGPKHSASGRTEQKSSLTGSGHHVKRMFVVTFATCEADLVSWGDLLLKLNGCFRLDRFGITDRVPRCFSQCLSSALS